MSNKRYSNKGVNSAAKAQATAAAAQESKRQTLIVCLVAVAVVLVAIILALLLINEMVYRIWMQIMGESISTSLDGVLVSWIIDMTSFLAMLFNQVLSFALPASKLSAASRALYVTVARISSCSSGVSFEPYL